MGIFSSIMDKIFHHAKAAEAPAAPGTPTAPPPAQKLEAVDIDMVLSALAAKKGGGGNYKTSIVDLLKLLDLDSSLGARKELATELSVRAGADGTAEQNIALQKAVLANLAANGGKVPDSWK